MSEFRYGDDKTIHQTEEVNVEVDSSGKVVSVWFRCSPLPFTQTLADEYRAKDMRSMYELNPMRPITAIVFKNDKVEFEDERTITQHESQKKSFWQRFWS
jgi:hypothetical protein